MANTRLITPFMNCGLFPPLKKRRMILSILSQTKAIPTGRRWRRIPAENSSHAASERRRFHVARHVRDDLRDASWILNYTPSASRWIDTYFSAGAEWDKEPAPEGSEKKLTTTTDFVLETGLKFRVNLTHSPFKFLTAVTDFRGVRFGVKNNGFFDINKFRYVVEFGAGTW